ncbi:MAG: hypothetical protein R3182_06150 [Draconibacterium sp.]|nr:hypothetical protein [Draconibacterium sp.]
MMEVKEILQLLHRYFNGESTDAEERTLEAYFQSGEVAEEVAEYAEFFGGISELATAANDPTIEDDVMDYILENEHKEKTKYRSMWKTVTGIAASIIIILGGFLLYQEQQKPFDDTFTDPDDAYAYATQTLQYVSGKYSKGFNELSNFEKLRKANNPVKKSTAPVVEFYEGVEKLKENRLPESQVSKTDSL